MTAKVILNPYAGRWNGLNKREQLESALKSANFAYDLTMTEEPGHGTLLAHQAACDGFSPIISAGGDGSISEVVNGIVRAAEEAHAEPAILGIIPLGTANDLVVNLRLPVGLPESINVITTGITRKIDLGEVTAWDIQKQLSRKRYFDNNSAIGLEPTVTLIQQRMTRLKGIIRYLTATLAAIMKNPQWTMQLEWEDGRYDGPATMVTVGNNPLTGGLFYMSPNADPYDGKLTCVYGYMRTRLQILTLLPRTMKPGPGSYVEHPEIHEVNVDWMKIHTNQPTPVHADGEILFEATQDLEYRILPNYLPVLVNG